MATQAPAPSHFHPRLIEAALALNENRLDVAERLLKPHLKDDPFDVAAMRMLAQPRVWLSYGHMLKTVGRQEQGIAAYRKAIEIKPALGEAWWSLANLKTVRFTAGDVTAMEQALDAPVLSDEDRLHLDFAIAK